MTLLRSNRCSRLSYEGRPWRADFAPRSRDHACAGELALLRLAVAGLGPLGPAPAHPGHSLRDEVTFRFRGGIRRVAP